MHELLKKEFVVSTLILPLGVNGGPIDFNATGDKFIFTPVVPIDIYRFGFIADTAMDPDAGGFVLALDHRVTAGTDTGRVEVATLTRANADLVAAGAGIFREVVIADADGEVAEDGSPRFVGPAGPLQVNPGQQAVLEVTNAVGAAATGYVWIEYVEHPFAGTRNAAYTEVTV